MYLTYEQLKGCYDFARLVIEDQLIDEVAAFWRKAVTDLNCSDFKGYFEECHNVFFASYNFKKLAEQTSGAIRIENDYSCVTYDANHPVTRQNFTCLHEIFHYKGHYLIKNYGKNYAQKLLFGDEAPLEYILMEKEADYGASMMQLNAVQLEHCINEHMRFRDISFKYDISYSALYNRLVSYLIFEKNVNQQQACLIVKDYQHNNKIERLTNILN